METVLLIVGLIALFLCGMFCGIAIKAHQATELMKMLEQNYKITFTKRQAS